MKYFFGIALLFILISFPVKAISAEVLDGYAQDLLETPQANEVTLEVQDSSIFAEDGLLQIVTR